MVGFAVERLTEPKLASGRGRDMEGTPPDRPRPAQGVIVNRDSIARPAAVELSIPRLGEDSTLPNFLELQADAGEGADRVIQKMRPYPRGDPSVHGGTTSKLASGRINCSSGEPLLRRMNN